MAAPVYVNRKQKLLYGTVNILLGIVLFTYSALLGRIALAIGFGMVFSGILRGKERIA